MKGFRSAIFVLLIVILALSACRISPQPEVVAESTPVTPPTPPVEVRATASPNPSTATALPSATAASTEALVLPSPTASSPTEAPTEAVPTPTEAGPWELMVADRHLLFDPQHLVIGTSLLAAAGKVWIGTVMGTIEVFNPQTGTFGKPILLAEGGGPGNAMPVMKMRLEGSYLWAWLNKLDMGEFPYLFAINPDTGEIAHVFDLTTEEWFPSEERLFSVGDFGVSPGKIWIDYHIIDAESFEVTPNIPMPGMTLFADGGTGWMWMTGELGGQCDDLLLVNTKDPMEDWCPETWPFFTKTAEGITTSGPGSPLLLAGDRMWIAGSISGMEPVPLLEAYPVDMEIAMQSDGPLASVELLDSAGSIRMVYAGDFLWLTYLYGDVAGHLYQLDAKTGETINFIDLVGDDGRDEGNVPMDLAADGKHLWVLTMKELIQITLP